MIYTFIITIIAVVTIVLYLRVLKKQKELVKKFENNTLQIEKLSKDLEDLKDDNSRYKVHVKELNDKTLNIMNIVHKIVCSIDIIQVNTSHVISKSITDIMKIEDSITYNKAWVIYLSNLMKYYSDVRDSYNKKHAEAILPSEIENYKAVIDELNQLLILITTISEESPMWYLINIYREILKSVEKINAQEKIY